MTYRSTAANTASLSKSKLESRLSILAWVSNILTFACSGVRADICIRRTEERRYDHEIESVCC